MISLTAITNGTENQSAVGSVG